MIALEVIAYSLGVMIIVAATFVLFIGGTEYAHHDRKPGPGGPEADERGSADAADADRPDRAEREDRADRMSDGDDSDDSGSRDGWTTGTTAP